MKWLVQEFINNGSNYLRMVEALDSLSVDYLIIHLDQKNQLSVVDKETKVIVHDSESVIEDFISDSNIMVYGSKTFALIAERMNLTPGSFMTENFEFEVLRSRFGSELLNDDFIVGDLFSLQPKWNSFFIRPTGNTKLFTGMKVNLSEFNEWKERESAKESPYRDASLMLAPVREIQAEYRFFVVDGKAVTGSSYYVGNETNTSLSPTAEIVDYAQRMVDLYPLARAYVLDIAVTSSGYKIVECNNINSSGLYNCNEYQIIEAINKMVF